MFIFVLSVVDGMKMRSKVQANGSPKAKERNSIVSYSFKLLTHNIVRQFENTKYMLTILEKPVSEQCVKLCKTKMT